MPSQKQVRWSQLRVGITVLVASVVLAALVFLMSGTGGMFGKKATIIAYFDNAAGLRVGAPVRLQGVDVGNVRDIRIVAERQLDPVQVTMRVSSEFLPRLRQDSTATLSTAGVLGEVFVDIDSKTAKGPPATDGTVLKALDAPDIQDVVRSTQGTLQNVQVLLKRLDNIVASIETGEGSVGKFIKDPALFDRIEATLAEVQNLTTQMSRGKGTVGKLLNDDELYVKINGSVDKLNRIVTDIEAGKGSAGKLLKDEQLYANLNQTVAKANKMMDDINSGRGAAGKLLSDPEFARKLEDTMTSVRNLSAKLESGEGTAGKLINDPSMYVNINQMLLESRNLVQAIRENPKKYLSIKLGLF